MPAFPVGAAERIAALESTLHGFGPGVRAARRELLVALAHGRIRGPNLLLRYHEALCFLRAYPDGPATLGAVEEALAGIAARVALLGHPERLDETGMAGTILYCPLSFAAARWLASRLPDTVDVDWQDADTETAMGVLLPWLSGLAAEEALVDVGVPYREWFAAVREPGRGSDLAAILKGLAAGAGADAHQATFDALAVRTRRSSTCAGSRCGPRPPGGTRARPAWRPGWRRRWARAAGGRGGPRSGSRSSG
jgi:hypothetical protein